MKGSGLPELRSQTAPEILDELQRASRLRSVQIGLIVVVSVLAIGITLLLARSLNQARDVHNVNADVADALVDQAGEAHSIIEEYLRLRGDDPTQPLPAEVFSRMMVLGGRVDALVDREQELDPTSGPALAARQTRARYQRGMALARDSLTNHGRMDPAYVNGILDGPVARYFEALDTWTAAARTRSEDSHHLLDDRTRSLVTWLVVMMLALAAGGAAMYVWFGRVRDRLMHGFGEAAAEQAALHRVATSVAESDEPRQVFQTIADEVVTLLGADGGWLDECERDKAVTIAESVPQEWRTMARGPDPRATVDPHSVRGLALRTGAPARIGDYRLTPGIIPQAALDLGIRTSVAAPIVVEGRPWGVVVALSRDPEALPPGCEARLVPFARLAGVAVANARARTLLAKRASTDALTLLPNHGAFHQYLTEAVAAALADGTSLGLVLLDIDHFKDVNDTFGHPAGDAVLLEVAGRMSKLVRAGEMIARTGGEEFAWVLPGTDRDGSRAAAERAREAVRALPVNDVGVVTVSAGVCTLEAAGDAHELLARADQALLAAKARGRDRTVVYERDGIRGEGLTREGRFQHARAIEALHMLARAVDARHSDTVDHAHRVSETAATVASRMGWDERSTELMRDAALLHDVGKIGRPSRDAERGSHAELGAQLLADVLTPEQARWVEGHDRPRVRERLGGDPAYEGTHILATANIWDNLVHGDGTRPALPFATAIDRMRAMRGTRLDAEVVDALLAGVAMGVNPRSA